MIQELQHIPPMSEWLLKKASEFHCAPKQGLVYLDDGELVFILGC